MPDLNTSQLREFSHRWKIKELALFGSALRGDFRPDSDVDVLVDFEPDARWSLFDLVDMREELMKIFGREVDLVTKRGLMNSRNNLRREAILSSMKVIYGS